MATSRNFAYNTGSQITGSTQYGNLAIGATLSSYGDDQDLVYKVILIFSIKTF